MSMQADQLDENAVNRKVMELFQACEQAVTSSTINESFCKTAVEYDTVQL
jgi:hypothetical protein